jgi:amidase
VGEGLSALGIQFGLSRSVRDCAALLDAVQGGAIGEPYEIIPPARPYLQELTHTPGPLRIGVLSENWAGVGVDRAISHALDEVVTLLATLGHRVEPAALDIGVSWEGFTAANATLWNPNLVNWCQAFASASGRPIDETTLERSTLTCYEHGLRISAADYLKAQDVRNIVTRRVGAFFTQYDVLLSPTTARMPIRVGTYLDDAPVDDALGWFAKLFREAPFTPVFNVAGTPAISLPLCVAAGTGLPIGMQFAGAFGREDLLLRLAGQLEVARPWQTRRPRTWAGNDHPGGDGFCR